MPPPNYNINNNYHNNGYMTQWRPNELSTLNTIIQFAKCSKNEAIEAFNRANGDLSIAVRILTTGDPNANIINDDEL